MKSSKMNDVFSPPADVGGPRQAMLTVEGLRKYFVIDNGFGRPPARIRAVDGVSLSVAKGETLGIVGESGCGKSTLGRLLMQLVTPDQGSIVIDGQPLGGASGLTVRELRRSVQMVFQDSYASLNPRMSVEESIAFGVAAAGVSRSAALDHARNLLDRVGLRPALYARRFPHQLSGGQRQRVNIARALAMSPRLVILDEAVSALDKSVEAQVLNLLQELKHDLHLTYIFISHDLNVVRHMSDRVLVMYLGKVVEIGAAADVYAAPQHPYTQGLLASRPSMNPAQRRTEAPLSGDPPSPIDPPSGCRFRTRCGLARKICAEISPELAADRSGHMSACLAVAPASGYAQSPAMGSHIE